MQHPGNWQDILTLLEDHLLQGSDTHPLSQSIRDYFERLGLPISDDAAEALLEIQSVAYFMRETSLPELTDSTYPSQLDTELPWSPGELMLIRDVLQAPGQWGLPELAGLLRRRQRTFPEGSLKGVVQALKDHPEWFGAVADLFNERAHIQLKKKAESSWLFPDGPPNMRALNSEVAHRHMLHWIWQQPEAMYSWVKKNINEISNEWWLVFLEKVGHRLPAQGIPLLDLLFPPSKIPQPFPVVRARIVLGDKELAEKLAVAWMPTVALEKDQLRVHLPEPVTAWSDLVSFGASPISPQEIFFQLGSCLRGDEIADKLGLSMDIWCDLVFRSPDSSLLVKVMAEQLRIHPHVERRLAWLEARLSLSEGEEVDIEPELLEGLPHEKVSGLIMASLSGSRQITDWDGPIGRILKAPSFYWSAGLTEMVVEQIKLRPTLLHSALTSPGFKEAFCWRGKMGILAKMIQGQRPMADLIPESLHRHRDEWVIVIQLRVALYKAFPS